MAKKHRKLFPVLSSEPNNTLDCSTGVCDQSCPYNCYQEPDYYALSPQLTPWSFQQPTTAPSPCPSPMNPAIYQQSQKRPFSLDAVTIISVTGAVFVILLIGFFIIAKFVTERVHRVNNEGYQSESHEREEFQDREQVDHPIWFIRTTGLQQSIINSITICRYKRGDGLIERTDCPVCLNEFEEEESLRLLPKCNHAFHISCIDTWLRSHTNCPLCRAGVAISMTPRCSGPVDVNPGGSESRVESDGDGDDESGERDHDQIQNRAELGREIDQPDSKERLSSSYRDSHITDPNSDVRNEISRSTNETHQNSEQIHSDGSENRNETEKKDETRAVGESTDQNEENSINSVSHTDNLDYTRKSCDDLSQNFNKPIREEANSLEENGDHKIQSRSRSKSMDSGESSGETTEKRSKSQSGISSNTSIANESSSIPRLNKNKSWVFPL